MRLTLSALPLSIVGTLLLCSISVDAAPAKSKTTKRTTKASIAEPAPKALHSCGVVVQRWGLDAWETFDQYYESNGKEFFHQATTGSTTPGDELVPVQVGSHKLHIYNTANPNGAHDPGKLSFVWGSLKFDTFSPGTPCTHNAYPDVKFTCTFQCDK
ncbi:hypothetical protein VTL71DRAFT_3553 [Oculimacula yallundae]|uniref:Uncharacterized protein n=1 Tax=Oculimacula yallundae TaxID=86028 RepID=A0ABR4C7G0_9HELO